MSEFLALAFYVALVVVLVIIGPTFTIWMLNKLFGLGLVNDWPTWFAALWLNYMVFNPVNNKK